MDVKQKIKWTICSVIYGSFVGSLAVVGYHISYNVLVPYWLKDNNIFLFIKAILLSSIALSSILVFTNFLFKKLYGEKSKKSCEFPNKYSKIAFEMGALIGSSPVLIYYLKHNDEYIGVLFTSILLIYIFSEYFIIFIVKYDVFKSNYRDNLE